MRRERTLEGVSSLVLLVGAVACSSPPPVPAAPSSSSPQSAAATKTDARTRLQGTWELTKFVSTGTIPDEAAPILGRLQGKVRLRFEGDQITTFIPGASEEEEKCPFDIADENGPSFTLITGLGMFRRAQARFVSDDVWEATENGPTWPGTTRFTRVRP